MCRLCNKPVLAKGLCQKHYARQYRYGRTNLVRQENGKARTVVHEGYIQVTVDGHKKLEHIHLAEKALGKPLPKGAQVHHINEIKWDNHTPFNLVVCPDQSYHMLLHKRARMLRVCS